MANFVRWLRIRSSFLAFTITVIAGANVPLSHRCLNYAIERAEDDGDPAARDLSNQKFWDKLHGQFHATLEMVRADAKAHGIDLDEPNLRSYIIAQEREERRWGGEKSSHRPRSDGVRERGKEMV